MLMDKINNIALIRAHMLTIQILWYAQIRATTMLTSKIIKYACLAIHHVLIKTDKYGHLLCSMMVLLNVCNIVIRTVNFDSYKETHVSHHVIVDTTRLFKTVLLYIMNALILMIMKLLQLMIKLIIFWNV